MTITTTKHKRCSLVKMEGRIDSSNADELLQALKSVNDSGVFKIVFDMEDVDFMSSKGFWALVETQKVCKRYNRGELVLAGVKQKIKDTLDLVGLLDYFKIYDDTISAVGAF